MWSGGIIFESGEIKGVGCGGWIATSVRKLTLQCGAVNSPGGFSSGRKLRPVASGPINGGRAKEYLHVVNFVQRTGREVTKPARKYLPAISVIQTQTIA